VDPLRIEELSDGGSIGLLDGEKQRAYLADDVARLEMANCLHELLHCVVVLSLGVEVVSILSMDVSHARFI